MLRYTHSTFDSSIAQMTYNKGEYIYHEGEDAKGVYQVLKGRVKLWKVNKRYHHSIIFHLVHQYELFGLTDFFGKSETRRCAASAMDNEVIVQYIPFSEFKRQVFEDRIVNFTVIQCLIKNYESCWERFREFISGDSTLRTFRAVQNLATEKGTITNSGIVLKGITHQELADYIGLSRQNVSAAMNNCRKVGMIEYDRKQILILKKQKSSSNNDKSRPKI